LNPDTRTTSFPAIGLGLAACVTIIPLSGCNPFQDGIGVGSQPITISWSVAVADMNGDGKADIMASYTCTTSATLNQGFVVYLQDPASPGNFLLSAQYGVGDYPMAMAIADLNGDKKADIVAVNEASVVLFLQNAANPGTFAAPTIFGAGIQPSWVAIADLNGDGKPDLAVANKGAATGGDGSVSVLLQDPTTPGSFLSARDYTTLHASLFVTISDLNSDGKPDLAAVDIDRIFLLFQDPTVPGQFQAAVDLVGAVPVNSVAAGDLNGDQKADLVIADSNGISIRFQDPARPGSFLSAIVIAN
jgi:hypothetical protein